MSSASDIDWAENVKYHLDSIEGHESKRQKLEMEAPLILTLLKRIGWGPDMIFDCDERGFYSNNMVSPADFFRWDTFLSRGSTDFSMSEFEYLRGFRYGILGYDIPESDVKDENLLIGYNDGKTKFDSWKPRDLQKICHDVGISYIYVSELGVADGPHRDSKGWKWEEIKDLIQEKKSTTDLPILDDCFFDKQYIDYFQAGINGISKNIDPLINERGHSAQSRGLRHGLEARKRLPLTIERVNQDWMVIKVDKDGITTNESFYNWAEIMGNYLDEDNKFEFLRGIYDFLHDTIIQPNEENKNMTVNESPYLQGIMVGRDWKYKTKNTE